MECTILLGGVRAAGRLEVNSWELEPAAFDRLLSFLNSDRDQSAQQYELIRNKLIKFFSWRGCLSPEEYADDTIDRVARRLSEGVHVDVANPYLYFHGIALKVLQEYWRSPSVQQDTIEKAPAVAQTASEPPDYAEREYRLDCLGQCMEEISPDTLQLLTTYHHGEKRARIDARHQFAASLGIPLNALRLRAFRVRNVLQNCIEECVRRRNS